MHSERDLQEYIKKGCIERGILCYKLEATSHRGMPDLILLHAGRVVFAEVKSPTGKGRLTVLQSRMLKRLRAAGFEALVIDSRASADALLNTYPKNPGATPPAKQEDLWRNLI